jgi:hypothetical protein
MEEGKLGSLPEDVLRVHEWLEMAMVTSDVAYKLNGYSECLKVLERAAQTIRVAVPELRWYMAKRGSKGLPKWALEDPDIRARLDRTAFEKWYLDLRQHVLQRSATNCELIRRAGGVVWDQEPDPKDYKTAMDAVADPDYKAMAGRLGVSGKTVKRLFEEAARLGIVEALPKRIGRGGKIVYKVGRWQRCPLGIRFYPLLTKERVGDKLGDFRTRRTRGPACAATP